jgi:hypothetical protein
MLVRQPLSEDGNGRCTLRRPGGSNILAESMAGDAAGARIDLNIVATTVVGIATSLTPSRPLEAAFRPD